MRETVQGTLRINFWKFFFIFTHAARFPDTPLQYSTSLEYWRDQFHCLHNVAYVIVVILNGSVSYRGWGPGISYPYTQVSSLKLCWLPSYQQLILVLYYTTWCHRRCCQVFVWSRPQESCHLSNMTVRSHHVGQYTRVMVWASTNLYSINYMAWWLRDIPLAVVVQ